MSGAEGGHGGGAAARAELLQQEELHPPRARVVFPRAGGENIGEQLENTFCFAGSWKHYTGAWRVELLLLQRLCAAGRASPVSTPSRQICVCVPSIEDLEATSGCKVTPRKNYEDPGDEWRTTKALMACLVDLPPPLVGKVASYWRTARDPLY